MSGAFVNFARTGDPNGGELPKWEPCQDGRAVTMVFDDECCAKEDLQKDLLPLVLKYKPPFKLDFGTPKDDEDEEGGSAWVF